MAHVNVDVVTSGGIPWGVKRELANIVRDCYRRFGTKIPYKVEVFIVDREASVKNLLKEEKFRRGLGDSTDDWLICTHDAWRGYPRIIVCYERLAALTRLARIGAVRHETAHSALHCSLEFSIFRVPDECRHAAMIKSIDMAVLEQVLYYVSAAVKDCEATKLLVDSGFIDCQFAFGLETLSISEQDKLNWKSATGNRKARFIYESALLRPTLFAHPLLSLPRSNRIPLEMQVYLGRRIEEIVEHLGDTERNKLLQVANIIAGGLKEDTHRNIDFALAQSMNLA
ncbi:MAG: hypothetical protein FJ024_04315 [Chloroflexi bacterium]|nr:hypothetical protein [Chloroflexota bacterium]